MGIPDIERVSVSFVGQGPPDFPAAHHPVFLRPFRRDLHAVIDGIFRAGEGISVGNSDDVPGFAPVRLDAVYPVGETLTVPVLPQGVDVLVAEEESHQCLPAGETEHFPTVAEDDGLAGRGIVGIEMAFRKPVHVRVDAFARREGGDDLAVAIEVDPDRSLHGAGVLFPGEAVGKTDGGEPDVLSGRDGDAPGGVSGRAGILDLETGRSGKEDVPGTGRQDGGEKEESKFPHGLFLPPR